MEIQQEADIVTPSVIEKTAEIVQNDTMIKQISTAEISLNDLIQKAFITNVKTLSEKFNLDDCCLHNKSNSKYSICFLNDILVRTNTSPNNLVDFTGLLTLRYYECENYRSNFTEQNFGLSTINIDFDSENDYLSFDLINQIAIKENVLKTPKSLISTLFTIDHTGSISFPLVVFPKNDPLDTSSDKINLIKNSVCLNYSQTGDFDSIEYFLDWLHMYIKNSQNSSIKIIFADKYLLLKLASIGNKESFDQVKKLMRENQVYILFYPFDTTANSLALSNFNNLWIKNVNETSQRENPNNETIFLFILKHTLRQFNQQFKQKFFNALIEDNSLDFKKYCLVENVLESSQVIPEQENNEDNSLINIPTENVDNNNKLSETEIIDYCNWVDEMSKINSLCIKHQFLRDIYNRNKPENQVRKEILCGEKQWNDLILKNQSKFKYSDSLGLLSENDYLKKSIDVEVWRQRYFRLVKHELEIEKADKIWHFEIIQFPFSLTSFILKQPEKDLERPKNTKSRISVLFAYSASGDYLQPYFVYPTCFSEENSELAANECFSTNGFVTPKIFTNWLLNFFMTYVGEINSNMLILYCSKLAIIDKNLMLNIQQNEKLKNRLKFFGLCNDSLKPFNLLFTKNLRNRPIDLFLDSWRKVTAKLKLSYQFKCKSRQQFFNLFMDTFQNCIEEIGNEDSNRSLNMSSVSLFKNKMISTFEQCKLWPVSEVEKEKEIEKIEPSPKRKKIDSVKTKVKLVPENGNKQNVEKNLLKNQVNSIVDNKSKSLDANDTDSASKELIKDLITIIIQSNSNRETNENGLDANESSESIENRLDALHKTSTNKIDSIRKLFDEINVINSSSLNENSIATKLSNVLFNFYQKN